MIRRKGEASGGGGSDYEAVMIATIAARVMIMIMLVVVITSRALKGMYGIVHLPSLAVLDDFDQARDLPVVDAFRFR
jgi:hypothetical protein